MICFDEAKKLQAAETRVKAAHERFMKAKQALESTSSAITLNLFQLFSYIGTGKKPGFRYRCRYVT